MRFPQLLIYESDGQLARLLEGTAGTHRWVLRQPRRVDAGLRLLRRGEPAIVVVKLERDLESAFTLLERTTWLFPEAASVVVTETDNAPLVELAWDLGAAYVLAPPQSRELLLEVVAGLMTGSEESEVKGQRSEVEGQRSKVRDQ
jgi:DNA-binding NarL/FixJ family response regulator